MSNRKKVMSVYEVPVKSDSTMTAQNGTLCESSTSEELLGTSIMAKLELLRSRSFDLHVFAVLQFRNALRVSELLNCEAKDVDVLGRIKVSALKGSNHKVIDLGEFREYVASLAKMGLVPWSKFNRFYVHREYLRVGLQLSIQGGVRRSVTHSLRHLSTQLLADQSEQKVYAQSILGHKDSKNTEVYVKTKSARLLASERQSSTKKSSKIANSEKKERSSSNSAGIPKSKAKKD